MESQKRRDSSSSSFLSLPREIRNDIYGRVLALWHQLYIFRELGSRRMVSFIPARPYQWLALLYTSRQIRDEASAALYGSNQFYIEEVIGRKGTILQSFLDRIGPVNSNSLRHLCIDFPALENVESPQGVTLRANGFKNLNLLQSTCVNLATLELNVYGPSHEALIAASTNNLQTFEEDLSQIDAQLRTISSLRKITIKFRDDNPAPSMKDFMQKMGWVVVRSKGP